MIKMRLLCALVLLAVFVAGSKAAPGTVAVVGTPVVYTNGDGGGTDEVESFADRDNYQLYDAHSNVCGAWWVPYDNIPDISAIYYIDVEPSGSQVRLQVRGVARTGRVRIKIFALICA